MDVDKRIKYFLRRKEEALMEIICTNPKEYHHRDYFKQKLKICNEAIKLLGKYKVLSYLKDKH